MKTIKLKTFFLFSVLCYLFSAMPLFASGKKDADDVKYLDNEWLLCVTAFDLSQLPPAHRITGEVLTRSLVTKMQSVNYRFRLSPEYAYYESYAWQQALNTAAKALSNKYNERSQLLYRGEPDWKYRSGLRKIDADLVKLEETYREKEAERPMINSEPVFNLIQSNLNGTYPAPPAPGGERRFCQTQKADAILTGAIREFHGRYFIRLRLFILYANSWVYEDDIIFSMEDVEGAVDEITGRLTAALSGTRPATIAVTAEPPESQILINQSYAGRGTVEARERPPGTVIVAVGADGYSPLTVETDLAPGEQVEIDVNLSLLHYSSVNINVPGGASAPRGAAVYHGALYVGEAPYTLRLPIDQLNYVTVENWNGETAKVVFTSPDMPDESFDLSLKTKTPPVGERRVNNARKRHYWAWAGVWFTGMAAWITDGLYKSQNAVGDPAFYDSAQQMQYISFGALIALGVAAANEIFWMTRYLYIATEDVVPIAKGDKKGK